MDVEKVIKGLKEIKHSIKVGSTNRGIVESTNAIDNAIWTIRELQEQNKSLLEDNAELHNSMQALNVFHQELLEQNKWHYVADGDLPSDRQWYLAMFQETDTGFIGLPYIADYLNGKHTKYTTDDGWIIRHCTDTDEPCEYYKHLKCIAWCELPKYESEG